MRMGRRSTLTPSVAVALPSLLPVGLLSAVLLSACAVDPVQYRVTAQVMDNPFLSGAHETVEAVRTERGWTVREAGRGGSARWLSAADGARLDAALASDALYEKPTDVAGGCVDPGLATLEITSGGMTRRLALECQVSPGIQAVLAVLFK